MKALCKIHNYGKRLESRIKRIKEGNYCLDVNKKYLLNYSEFLFAEGLSLCRIDKCLRLAAKIDKVLNKNLKKLNKSDFINYLSWIEKSDYAEWTKCDLRVGLRKFIRWINNGKEPKCLSIVRTSVKNPKKLLPQEILTEEEVLKMIGNCFHLRDKALVSCLYESGCRIGEILTLRIKHVSFDEYGSILSVNGKTGVRQVRLISSTSVLSQWLADHPNKDNPDMPVWSSYRYKNHRVIGYNYVRKMLRKLAKESNVRKRVNPHSFRHARCTHLANKLTEAQMKMYFGWTQSSKMAAVYVHLSGRDVDNAILELHGIKRKEEPKSTFSLKKCRCGQSNPPTNKYCKACGQILDLKLQLIVEEKKKKARNLMDKLMEQPELIEKLSKLVVSQ